MNFPMKMNWGSTHDKSKNNILCWNVHEKTNHSVLAHLWCATEMSWFSQLAKYITQRNKVMSWWEPQLCLFVCLFGCLYLVVLMLWTWTISFNLTISDIPDIPVSLVAQTVCWNINLFRTVKIEGYWRVTGHSEGWEAPRGERGSERTLRGGGEWKDTRGKRGVRGHSGETGSERTLRIRVKRHSREPGRGGDSAKTRRLQR